MSRLKELRLQGFKSFAEPTRFVFEPGVTALIGPNGSGKSNMADAVRWVLGEQSNRSLRTRRADDVIFTGSQQRRALGMAEAILTLDNADGWLPIEFAEVSIGRRAYRSGESEYLVNGARVRLRDVVELLGAGALGASELVVVGQGTVDAALSLRPEERRQLFEEAAGVKNLQVRKNEALGRLAKARDNLSRVTDLLGELRPQVRRLALQAAHQQEHASLVRRARDLLHESHRRRDLALRGELGDARRRAAAAEAELEAHLAEQAAARSATEQAEAAYWASERSSRAASEAREVAREATIRAEAALEALLARRDEATASLETAESYVATTRRALADLEAMAESAGSGDLAARAAAAEIAWRAAADDLAGADRELAAIGERLAEARGREAERLTAAAHRAAAHAAAAARGERLRAELGEVDDALQRAAAAEPELAERAATTTRDAASAASALREAAAAVVVAHARHDAARRRASDLAERAGALRGELAALDERAARGGDAGALRRLSAPRLVDLAPPADAWRAIEAIVGGDLDRVLTAADDELLERLVVAGTAARVLAASTGRPVPSDDERTAALAAVGADRTLADWTGPAAPALFARIAIAPDVRALLRGWRRLPAGWGAVTPDGEFADGRGFIVLHGTSGAFAESARVAARRSEVGAGMEAADREEREARDEVARVEKELAAARRRLEVAGEAQSSAEAGRRMAAADIASAEERRAALVQRREDLTRELRAMEAPIDSTEDESIATGRPAPVNADGGKDAQAVDALAARAAQLREARIATAAAEERARTAWLSARAEADEVEQRSAGAYLERATLLARVEAAEGSLPKLREALATLEPQIVAARASADVARETEHAATDERSTAAQAQEELRVGLLALERRAAATDARLHELERASQLAAVEASRHEEAVAGLEREHRLALDTLPEVAAAELNAAPSGDPAASGAADELGALADEPLEVELRRVRRTLAQIGGVNPFAVEEHAEVAARLAEVSAQDGDLRAAIGSIEELIRRLESDISGQFNAAFAAIGERFDEFCRLLFAGGSAALQLSTEESDDDAAAGIEIVVRPPGKRLQRLAMLSGGERALTGVALLFAMLSVNPVPFCILDEVDAALDEANIGRFAAALRRLAERTDFVVITHNRATIEIADTIYGITMTDAAVSRVLSLRLGDVPVQASA